MAERKIAGTNEVYTGMVVKLGEFEYTTVGGGIEGDRQQLEPMDNTDVVDDTNTNTPNTDTPVYFEDYDIGTNDGILNTVDAVYWNNLGRTDIASMVQQFITSGNFPPNIPTQGGQADMGTNQQNQEGGGGMSENTGNNSGGNQGGGGGMY